MAMVCPRVLSSSLGSASSFLFPSSILNLKCPFPMTSSFVPSMSMSLSTSCVLSRSLSARASSTYAFSSVCTATCPFSCFSSSSCSSSVSSPFFSVFVRFRSTSAKAKANPKSESAIKANEKKRKQKTTNKEVLAALRESHAAMIKRYKPVTPSLRHTILLDRSDLWRGRPVGALTVGLRKHGGRSRTTGRITVRHRGGGFKRLYRVIDFKRDLLDAPCTVQRIEFDPNRSAHIALVRYNHNGELRYILAPKDLRIGDVIRSSRTEELDLQPGNSMPLSTIPIGTVVHSLELQPGRGAQIARSAGASCTLLDKNSRPGYALVELTSREQRYILLRCLATVGSLSNPLHKIIKLGKAGRSRNLGRRPHVRGVAMNPIDHPHGGGGGKKKGRLSCSPTGVLAKGFKTRRKSNVNKHIVVPRGGIKKGSMGGVPGAR